MVDGGRGERIEEETPRGRATAPCVFGRKSTPMRCGGGRTADGWRERISCLVKFHGTMDGTRVAVCNLQPSFNQYSRYTYGPERFSTLENSMRGILRASYVDRSESAVETRRSHFSFSPPPSFFLLNISRVIYLTPTLLSIGAQFARSLAGLRARVKVKIDFA